MNIFFFTTPKLPKSLAVFTCRTAIPEGYLINHFGSILSGCVSETESPYSCCLTTFQDRSEKDGKVEHVNTGEKEPP